MNQRVLLVLKQVLGWRTYACGLMARLEERNDIDVEVLSFGPTRLESMFVQRHNRAGLTNRLRGVDPVSAYRSWLGKSIRSEIRRTRPDAIHFAPHWPAAAVAFEDDCPPFTMALDCTCQNIHSLRGRDLWSPRAIQEEGALLRRATRLYPMSGWVARSLVEDYGVPGGRIDVMPPPVAMGPDRPCSGRSPVPIVLFVGNDFVRKGGERLCRWVQGALAGSCELHIVSADPRAQVTGLGIVCHGGVPNETVRKLMAEADVLCLPTRSDMSPQVLAEAAAAGLPCVASDIGGIGDLVLHGDTGLLVPPADDTAFITALRRLLHDRLLREQMAAAAFVHARAALDAGRSFGRLLDDLARIAGSRPEAPFLPREGRRAGGMGLAGTA